MIAYISKFAPRKLALIALFTASGAMLSACVSTGGSMAQSNPNFFTAKIKDGKLNGSYNPAGFKTEEVKQQLASSCNGGALAGYGESKMGDLVAFTATCKNGTAAYGGRIEVERAGDKIVQEGTTYDANGKVSYNRV